MTQNEIKLWLRDLPIQYHTSGGVSVTRPCESDAERVKVLNVLLHHAAEDCMSEEDRSICVQALTDLGAPYERKKRRWTRGSAASLKPLSHDCSLEMIPHDC